MECPTASHGGAFPMSPHVPLPLRVRCAQSPAILRAPLSGAFVPRDSKRRRAPAPFDSTGASDTHAFTSGRGARVFGEGQRRILLRFRDPFCAAGGKRVVPEQRGRCGRALSEGGQGRAPLVTSTSVIHALCQGCTRSSGLDHLSFLVVTRN